MALGKGAQLAKMDIESAFRIIPVHSKIRLLSFKEFGILVATHKCTGPTICLVFLDILINMMRMEISQKRNWNNLKVLSQPGREERTAPAERAPVINWAPPTCCKGGASRKVCSGYAFNAPRTQKATSLYSAQRILQDGSVHFSHPGMGVLILYRLNQQAAGSKFHKDTSDSWGCTALWEGHWFQLSWVSCPSFASARIASYFQLRLPPVHGAIIGQGK